MPGPATRRVVARIKDKMSRGAKLMKMHDLHRGIRWYLVPGGEVEEHHAKLVIAEKDVFPRRDGVWPGMDQTWGLGEPK